MSTTTETKRGPLVRLGRHAAALAGLAALWVAAMAVIVLVTEAGPAALAVVPGRSFVDALPGDVRIVRGGGHVLVLASEEPGYVRRLYRAGALLVLPARKNGCLDVRAFSGLTGIPASVPPAR